jgi:hypothetical protein
MALTRKMFLDTLPRALGSDAYTVDGDLVTLHDGARTLRVTFAAQETFKLGGFSIPRAHVTLAFVGYAPQDVEDAVKRFERYFPRGGG